jgi:hypothetical protein
MPQPVAQLFSPSSIEEIEAELSGTDEDEGSVVVPI